MRQLRLLQLLPQSGQGLRARCGRDQQRVVGAPPATASGAREHYVYDASSEIVTQPGAVSSPTSVRAWLLATLSFVVRSGSVAGLAMNADRWLRS